MEEERATNLSILFRPEGKTYQSETDINPLNFYKTFIEKKFPVVYLKRNLHVNRLYISVPLIKIPTRKN